MSTRTVVIRSWFFLRCDLAIFFAIAIFCDQKVRNGKGGGAPSVGSIGDE